MPRLKQKQYQRHVMFALMVYTAMMVLVWPLVRTASDVPLRWVLALAPVPPMLYVIALMARRIRDSDELEQRTHLIGLGVATGVVATLSLAGGFLASAQVLALDGSVLIWVFPLMMACYGVTRWLVARRYGNDLGCDAGDSVALRWRLAFAAAIFGFMALAAYVKRDDIHTGMLAGMLAGAGSVIAAVALAKARVYWRKRRAARLDGPNGA